MTRILQLAGYLWGILDSSLQIIWIGFFVRRWSRACFSFSFLSPTHRSSSWSCVLCMCCSGRSGSSGVLVIGGICCGSSFGSAPSSSWACWRKQCSTLNTKASVTKGIMVGVFLLSSLFLLAICNDHIVCVSLSVQFSVLWFLLSCSLHSKGPWLESWFSLSVLAMALSSMLTPFIFCWIGGS